MCEERKSFAGEVNKIAKMLVRMAAFLKRDNIQCRLDTVVIQRRMEFLDVMIIEQTFLVLHQ